jgi:hypothetical protein
MPLDIESLLISNISFCNKEASNIRCNDFKQKMIEYLDNKYNIKISNKDFVKINQNILKKNLEKHQHIISLKSTGNPYYFFLTKIKDQNCCFYIDQKIVEGHNYPRIIYVQYRFADYLFNDTLINGELIKTYDNEWSFLISDLILLEGKTIESTSNIHQRIDLIYKILSNNYQPDPIFDICPLQVRRLFYYNELDYLVNNFIPNLGYNSKAICFHTLNLKYDSYIYYFSEEEKKEFFGQQSKVKEDKLEKRNALSSSTDKESYNKSQLANILFVKTAIDDIYQTYCNDDNKVKDLGYAAIPTQRHSHQLRVIFNQTQGSHIFNCRYSKIFKKWIPIEEIKIKDPDQWTKIKKIIDDIESE